MATSLHEFLDVDFIKDRSESDIQHLHISMDEITGKICYDRTLKAGNGSKIYGLEVSRFLKMSDHFLQKANVVHKAVLAIPYHFVEAKPSKYNSDMYVDARAICGATESETHHIRQQRDANGYIGDVHKDARSNIVVLCETCHLAEHHGTSKIEKTVMTSEGVEYVQRETL